MRNESLERIERQRRVRATIAALLFCFGVAAAIYGAANWSEGAGSPGAVTLTITVLGVVAAIAGLSGVLVWRPGEARRRLAETGSYRDRVQREWVSRITILPAATLGITMIAMSRADEWITGEDRGLSGVLLAGAAALNLLIIPLMVMGWDGGSRKQKRLLDDELTRAFRAQALTWAFWMLLIGVTGLYMVGLWSPRFAVVFMPMVMWAAAATAALKFSALHKRAEQEARDDE